MKSYKRIKYIIKKNPRMGFWLAYIRLPNKNIWAKATHYDEIDIDCHGGLTFMAFVKSKEDAGWQEFTKGTWVGWDYGHVGDYTNIGGFIDEGKRWTYEEVENEVKEVIDSLNV